jgi:hypothetical protein
MTDEKLKAVLADPRVAGTLPRTATQHVPLIEPGQNRKTMASHISVLEC